MEKSFQELIRDLCEKHIDKRKCVNEGISIQSINKKLRVKSFEILLKKRERKRYGKQLPDINDPLCHLLAWQYSLKNELNQPEAAEALKSFIQRLDTKLVLGNEILKNVIMFLVYLRGSCRKTEQENLKCNLFSKTSSKYKNNQDNSAIPYDLYQEHKFHFPPNFEPVDLRTLKTYPLKLFTSQPSLTIRIPNCKNKTSNEQVLQYKTDYNFTSILNINDFQTSDYSELQVSDEGYESPMQNYVPDDIWETVSKLPANKYASWETLDNCDPIKERPFACEAGPKVLDHFQKILDANTYRCLENEDYYAADDVTDSVQFIKCLKYMLVGMSSNIFLINENEMFYLNKGTRLEGLSEEALVSFCDDLINCGYCYRALSRLCSENHENNGYIFKELCESVLRYLVNYRVAILSMPDTVTLLTIHSYVKRLQNQICTLARVCKVGIYTGGSEKNKTPLGAQLLDYIYQEIINTVDYDVVLMLYSVFYPCCQIYFRFLQRWLFEGILNDPYDEFLVKSDLTYMNSRARTYWTRNFTLRQNAVPEFLNNLKTEILQCGKTMNLLKLCKPDAVLYTHIVGRFLPLVSCCLTSAQIEKAQQEMDIYYVEMASLCGPRISLYHRLRERYENNLLFISLAEKKRALTIKRFELLKQQEAEEKAKKKRILLKSMQEEMALAAEQKKKAKEEELQRDLEIAKQNALIEEKRMKFVNEESKLLIQYYNNLIEAVDRRRSFIEQRKKQLQINWEDNEERTLEQKVPEERKITKKQTISETPEKNPQIKQHSINVELSKDVNRNVNSTKTEVAETNLDVTNANLDTAQMQLINERNETMMAARRNRQKILNLEFGVHFQKAQLKPEIIVKDTSHLTEAQRNKMKVLSSEFDMYWRKTDGRNINEVIVPKEIANLASPGHENVMNTTLRKEIQLTLPESEPVCPKPSAPIPMSVDSTPNTECATTPSSTKLSLTTDNIFDSTTTIPSVILTASSTTTDDGFKFPETGRFVGEKNLCPTVSYPALSLTTDNVFDSTSTIPSAVLTTSSTTTDDGFKFSETGTFVGKNIFSTPSFNKCNGLSTILATNSNIIGDGYKFPDIEVGTKMLLVGGKSAFRMNTSEITVSDMKELQSSNLKLLLYRSVCTPLEAQMKLVNTEILKYFVHDQNLLSHLHSLRCYYFLLDGEFGRHVTEGLFNKLYQAKNSLELLNGRSLQLIINRALYVSSKVNENADRLSFIVQEVPKVLDLNNIDVFECLSLSYRINWPLNILLPCDTIEKYDYVFKYLLKLHHVSWVLQKMFQELKVCPKELKVKEAILMQSPQYHQLQLYRHTMTYFVQTLQNYTVSEVLQASWEELENNIKTVNTLDHFYSIHTIYIKTIIFRCLLNRKCAPIMKVIREIFIVILKFYNYFKSRSWILQDNCLLHPNFRKLEDIFNKFEEYTKFVFRVGNKMARVGYQPHLIQMLDMLDLNGYYSRMQNNN